MKRLILAALAIAVLPLAAQAGDLSYNYLQAGYNYAHNDNSDQNSPGWEGTASAALGQHFQVFGGGGVSNRDASSASGQNWNLGAGFHTPVSDQTDFVGDLSYRHGNIDGVSGDVKTYSGEVGVRSALAPQFEGWLMAGYSNATNDTGDIDRSSKGHAYGTLGGQYKFTKNWGLVAEGRLASDTRGIFVGPRYSF
jgi:Ax21 family sulfation-dependent quorum factor